ncbi:MAG: hypothetical protein OXG98_02010, partial [Gemmatimonadetes bacterium]|nr:hypothetical protein [Gemmatimonadota bacterium]
MLSPSAGQAERRAAREFQRILKRMGGVELPILRDPAEPSGIGNSGSHSAPKHPAGRVFIGWRPPELNIDLS